MNLYYNLPQKDKEQIDNYIALLADKNIFYCGNEHITSKEFLTEWSRQKQRLYKLFGNQFRIEIDMPKNITIADYQLGRSIAEFVPSSSFTKQVIRALVWGQDGFLYYDEIFESLIETKVLIKGKIDTETLNKINHSCEKYEKDFNKSLHFSVVEGMSVFKAIKKLLHVAHIDSESMLQDFEEWRTKLSFLTMNAKSPSKIVLSIHPIDFLTLSDNNCNWSSCYSTLNRGCYCSSTITMMNSKLAVVAYLENPNCPFEVEGVGTIPNKMWRSLFFVDKNLLLSGVSYPYPDENVQKVVLKELKKRVAEKFHWHYKYNYEPYYDTKNYYSNANLYEKGVGKQDYRKRKILVRTPRGTYNDFTSTSNYIQLCCRNDIAHNKIINLGGCRTSLLDGETTRYFSGPEMAGNRLFF